MISTKLRLALAAQMLALALLIAPLSPATSGWWCYPFSSPGDRLCDPCDIQGSGQEFEASVLGWECVWDGSGSQGSWEQVEDWTEPASSYQEAQQICPFLEDDCNIWAGAVED